MISFSNPDFSKTPVTRKQHFKYSLEKNSSFPEVSIVTPFYNTSAVFKETVHCILNQSFQNFEWIIVDDCSSNQDSISMLDELIREDDRCRVIRNANNLGPSGSRNRGINAAKGNYIFFVDSDDLVEPTIIEKYWLFLQLNKEPAFCNAWHIGFESQEYLWQKGFEHEKNLLYENVIQPTFMARRELFDSVKFDESIKDGFEDWDFWMQCAASNNWGNTIPEFLYWYRRAHNTAEKWKNWDMGQRMKNFSNQLIEKYESRIRYAKFKVTRDSFTKGDSSVCTKIKNKKVNILKKTEKKRLFFIIPWMTMGGADKFNLDLVKGLSGADWEITIVTTQPSNNNWEYSFVDFSTDIFHLHNYADEASFAETIEYLLESRRPDLILLSNSENGYYLLPFIKFAFPEIPVLDYNHMEELYWNKGGHPRQSAIYEELLSGHIVSSGHLKKWLAEQGCEKKKIHVVYTGNDASTVCPNESIRQKKRKEWDVEESLCIIAFSGRLAAQKQPYVLIDTIKLLTERVPDGGFVLAIAGNGPEQAALERYVAEKGLEGKVWFLGALSNKDNIELLQTSDIFFLPSLWEGISLAMYEAMAVGLPVVGADVGGQKELITRDCGILIQRSTSQQEAEAYALILERLVKNARLRKEMGTSGRARILDQFTLEKMWSSMDAILTSHIEVQQELSKEVIKGMYKQQYALFFHEKRVAEQLWHEKMHVLSHESASKTIVKYSEERKHKHIVKEIRWYHENYEPLPLWYKRAGFVVRVLCGRQSVKSLLFSKYRPDPKLLNAEAWYSEHYEQLPGWYKKMGAGILKK